MVKPEVVVAVKRKAVMNNFMMIATIVVLLMCCGCWLMYFMMVGEAKWSTPQIMKIDAGKWKMKKDLGFGFSDPPLS